MTSENLQIHQIDFHLVNSTIDNNVALDNILASPNMAIESSNPDGKLSWVNIDQCLHNTYIVIQMLAPKNHAIWERHTCGHSNQLDTGQHI